MWADRTNPDPVSIEVWENKNSKSKPRQTYIHKAYERDASFREKVLKAYDYMCAICRCTVKPVLEAHHIIYVSDNGNDHLYNGICLCRNHHKMVHSKLIKLNCENNTYEIDNSISEDTLTKWAIENYNKQLIIPTSKRQQTPPPTVDDNSDK